MEFPAWDPVLIDIPGLPIDIRWYGLMYVIAFIFGQIILTRFARRGFLPLPPAKVADLVLYMVFGVLLGGRIGFALFYDQELLAPGNLVQVWKGGLAFHGGLLGVIIAMLWFAHRNKLNAMRLGDAIAMAVPPGVFFVRMANFINGELYGRITEAGVGLSMRFPTDPTAQRLLGLSDTWTMRDRELAVRYAMGKEEWGDIADKLSQVDSRGAPIDWEAIQPGLNWEAIADQVPYRHPSQLYEGFGEGLAVGLMLLAVYLATRRRPLRPGTYGALFLMGYAVVRFFIEFLRQPDRQFTGPDDPVGTVFLGMTMGQTLCVGMIVAGVLVLVANRRYPRTELVPPQDPEAGVAP